MAVIRIAASASLQRWDVKHVLAQLWQRPSEQLAPFGTVARRRFVVNEGGRKFGSIHFDGRISTRPSTTSLKGTTYVAMPGDVVFSRIDIRNGAIGVVPVSGEPLAFTNEFPIYDVASLGHILPDYVQILCRTRVFRSQIEAIVAGHSGRKRVTAEQFEQLKIPVPSLEEQEFIVRRYRDIMSRSLDLEDSAAPMLENGLQHFLKSLGIDYVAPNRGLRTLAISSSKLSRWAFGQAAEISQGLDSDLKAAFTVAKLGSSELCEIGRGISKTPSTRTGDYMRPYIRVANIQPWGIDFSDIKELNIPPKLFRQVKLNKGDILVCRNNSLELVGKAAYWDGPEEEYSHDDHVFRIRTNPDVLNSRYLFNFLSTDFARSWFRSKAQITTNLAGISGSALTELPIPIPPIDVQVRLSEEVERARSVALEMRQEAENLAHEADAQAEYLIVNGPSSR